MIKEKDLIIKLLSVLFPQAIIYLFGSRARGTYSTSSDIDIAIDARRSLSSLEIARAKNVIAALNIPQSIDIVDFNTVPKSLQEIILKEGIVWKH